MAIDITIKQTNEHGHEVVQVKGTFDIHDGQLRHIDGTPFHIPAEYRPKEHE